MDMCQRQGSQRGVVHGTAVFTQNTLLTSLRVAEKTIGGRSSAKGQGSLDLVPGNIWGHDLAGSTKVPKVESGESGLFGHDDQPYFLCPTTRSCSIRLLSIPATFKISCLLHFCVHVCYCTGSVYHMCDDHLIALTKVDLRSQPLFNILATRPRR